VGSERQRSQEGESRLIYNMIMSLILILLLPHLSTCVKVLFCCSLSQWQYQDTLQFALDLDLAKNQVFIALNTGIERIYNPDINYIQINSTLTSLVFSGEKDLFSAQFDFVRQNS
jgi:hypothetical protein